MKWEYLFTAWKKEDRDSAVIQLQKQCIIALLLFCILLLIGWISAPARLRVYIPPDLRNGATLKINEIPPALIYSFAYEIWQELNYWQNNGSSDYSTNLRTYTAYLTSEFQAELKHEFQELSNSGQSQRQRNMQGVGASAFDSSLVKKLSNSTWEVDLKMHLQEYKNNQRVKDAVILYPLKITRFEGAPSANPYGLALAGFTAAPKRLMGEATP
jgi:integrating conjugative element protein (TIGR03746 family)